MSDSRTKTLFKDTAWFAIGNFGSKVLSLLLVPLYTNILSTGEYGQADILNTTVNLAVPILTLSVQDAAFRFALDKNSDKDSVFANCFYISVLSPLLLLLFYPILNLFLPTVTEYWWFFFAIYLGHSLAGLMGNYLKATNRSNVFAIQGIIYTFIFAGSNVYFLVFLKIGIFGYLLSFVLGYIVSCLYMFVAGKLYSCISWAKINRALTKEMLKYSLPLIPAAVAWWVMSSIDRYMLLYMLGEDSTGIYSVAHKIPTIVTTVMTFFVNSWQISAVRNKDDNDIASYTSNMYKMLVLLGAFLTFVLVLLSQPIGFLLFAKKFYIAWTMSASLCVATLVSTLSLVLGAQFTASKRSDLHLKSNVIAMIANVVFNYVLIRFIGVNGAAYGTMLSYYLVLIYRQYKVKELIDLDYNPIRLHLTILLLISAAIITGFNIQYYYLFTLILMLICVLINLNDYKNVINFAVEFYKNAIRKRRDKK